SRCEGRRRRLTSHRRPDASTRQTAPLPADAPLPETYRAPAAPGTGPVARGRPPATGVDVPPPPGGTRQIAPGPANGNGTPGIAEPCWSTYSDPSGPNARSVSALRFHA